MKKTIWYFAYGSNLLRDRLEWRVGKVGEAIHHSLKDYELFFNCAGYADIGKKKGKEVAGVLYQVTGKQLNELSRFELLYDLNFFTLPNGEIAFCYIGRKKSNIDFFSNPPTHGYLDYIITGAIGHGLTSLAKEITKVKSSIKETTDTPLAWW